MRDASREGGSRFRVQVFIVSFVEQSLVSDLLSRSNQPLFVVRGCPKSERIWVEA